jgi:hypothetical protein
MPGSGRSQSSVSYAEKRSWSKSGVENGRRWIEQSTLFVADIRIADGRCRVQIGPPGLQLSRQGSDGLTVVDDDQAPDEVFLEEAVQVDEHWVALGPWNGRNAPTVESSSQILSGVRRLVVAHPAHQIRQVRGCLPGENPIDNRLMIREAL